jgi:hypothetical protein
MSREILIQEFESIKKDIITLYDQKGMRASGNFAESLEVVVNSETSVKIIGNDYAVQLEQGRNAGKFPPIKAIEQWIKDKGVFNEVLQKIKVSSLAFLIARKIAKNGWKREKFGGVQLISSVITDERIQSIIDKVGEVETIKFTNELIDMLQSIKTE